MSKQWDFLMKTLVGTNPQHLVSLLLPGAQYESELNPQLQSHTIEADLLYTILWNGRKAILHVEFQRRGDSNMGRRLWEYNAQTSINTGLPVCSFVIYLKRDGKVVESPYKMVLPDNEVAHHFNYRTVKLWELPAEVFKQADVSGLLPLLPLTRGTAKRELVEDMITSLDSADKNELLALGFAFAALVLTKPDDRNWLEERATMLEDILEESWFYQEMVEKGLAKGRQQGLQQELQKLRKILVDITDERFPEIGQETLSQVQTLNDEDVLHRLIVKMSLAKSAQEAEQAILAAVKPNAQ